MVYQLQYPAHWELTVTRLEMLIALVVLLVFSAKIHHRLLWFVQMEVIVWVIKVNVPCVLGASGTVSFFK